MVGAQSLSFLVLGFAVCVGQATAQTSNADSPAPSPRPPATFRSGVEVVALSVTVLDLQQRLVGDLARQDFAVFEDGVRQDVRYFETRDVPLDLAILIDTSVSMEPKLPFVRKAAAGFATMLRPTDRASVMAFNDRVQVLTGFTSDAAAITQAIQSTKAAGGTALYNAVFVALRELRKGVHTDDTVRRRAIVVLTDGEDTASLLSFDELLAEARRAGVTIYTIGLRTKDPTSGYYASRTRPQFSNADYAMKALAQETGATVHFPRRPADVAEAYDSIGKELAQQYAIGYVSRNPLQNGKFRRVLVQVLEHPEMRPRTRPGYTAGSTTELALANTTAPQN
jgi:Ca-activated chloride channel family protein